MKSAATLAGEIAIISERRDRLVDKLTRLRKEYNDACVREAQDKHPWIGKKVKQAVSSYRGGDKTRKGTLTVYDREKHRGLRQLPYGIEPGALIVVTEGGQTGYPFYTEQEIANINSWGHSSEKPWELIA